MSYTPYFVSRQIYWDAKNYRRYVVEISDGGRDCASTDMLEPKYPKEGVEYIDPRAAVDAAIQIAKLWQRDEPEEEIYISCGPRKIVFTSGSLTDKILAMWAHAKFSEMPKCDNCGDLLQDENCIEHKSGPLKFCSEHCIKSYKKDINCGIERHTPETKLKVGDVIEAQGFVMLRGIDDGNRFKVKEISRSQYGNTYLLVGVRGTRRRVRFYTRDIDLWVKPQNHPDVNKIVIVNK